VVGAQPRSPAVPALLAGLTCLAAVVLAVVLGRSGPATPTGTAGPAPTGLSTRFDDESAPSADATVAWRTFWVLCWDAYDGAASYELRTLTGEGASSRLTRIRDRCYRIEAAAGTSRPDALAGDRAQLLASQQGQLAVQIRAVVDGGRRSDWTEPVAVGSRSG
jgi:hypothetical protein